MVQLYANSRLFFVSGAVFMKKSTRKNLIFLFAAIIGTAFFALFPGKTAQAATPADVTRIVENYWNTVTGNGSQKAYWNAHYFAEDLKAQTANGDYLTQITRSPCTVTPGAEHLYVNGCTSNNFHGFSQCWGFALYMGYICYGALNESPEYGWQYYSVPDSFHFQAGDHIRYGWRENGTTATHSLFIYKVENGVCYTIECNWGSNCLIGKRSFSEEQVRYFVNRFNSGDDSDFVFRPYNVTEKAPEPPKPVIKNYTDTIWHMAGGFEKGEGQNGDKTAFFLSTTYLEAKNGSSFTLSADNAVSALPNGFYRRNAFITEDISGSWEWYDMPREVTQAEKAMEFGFWYYPVDYTIRYELNGGVNHPANPDSYNVLYGVSLKRPKRAGYMFAGWMIGWDKVHGINKGLNASFSSVEDMMSSLSTRTTGDVTVTATWERLYHAPKEQEAPQRDPYVTAQPAAFGE